MTPASLKKALALALALVAIAPAAALAAPPDPLARGPYTVTTVDPVLIGTIDLQEPNAAGGALTGHGRGGHAAGARLALLPGQPGDAARR